MKTLPRTFVAIGLLLCCLSNLLAADKPALDPSARIAAAHKIAETLKPQSGEIVLHNGLAKATLPATLRYLNSADAEKVLTELWGNPKDNSILGLIVPADFDPFDDNAWVVVISYAEDGYVKDDDAAKIDYGKLMKEMQEGTHAANKERVKQGYPPVELIGWATPPRYDAATKKLYWAKELEFGDSKEHTLNYNIRMLGRRGVLVLNAVGDMKQLKQIEEATPSILAAVDFQQGHRYADFDSSTDKTATYGLAALVAGGIAAKTGLLKMLWVAILALKKFVIIALVAISAAVKKFWGKLTGRKPAAVAVAEETPTTPAE